GLHSRPCDRDLLALPDGAVALPVHPPLLVVTLGKDEAGHPLSAAARRCCDRWRGGAVAPFRPHRRRGLRRSPGRGAAPSTWPIRRAIWRRAGAAGGPRGTSAGAS